MTKCFAPWIHGQISYFLWLFQLSWWAIPNKFQTTETTNVISAMKSGSFKILQNQMTFYYNSFFLFHREQDQRAMYKFHVGNWILFLFTITSKVNLSETCWLNWRLRCLSTVSTHFFFFNLKLSLFYDIARKCLASVKW